MKVEIRKDFCLTDRFTLGPRDNIVITLNKSEMDLLNNRGFVNDSDCPVKKIMIIKEVK